MKLKLSWPRRPCRFRSDDDDVITSADIIWSSMFNNMMDCMDYGNKVNSRDLGVGRSNIVGAVVIATAAAIIFHNMMDCMDYRTKPSLQWRAILLKKK